MNLSPGVDGTRNRVKDQSGPQKHQAPNHQSPPDASTRQWPILFLSFNLRSYSITSSALSRNSLETFKSIALAVLRLSTNLSFCGSSIGSSDGLAPLNILSARTAPCLPNAA